MIWLVEDWSQQKRVKIDCPNILPIGGKGFHIQERNSEIIFQVAKSYSIKRGIFDLNRLTLTLEYKATNLMQK